MLDHEHGGEQAWVNPVKTTAVMVAVAVIGGILVFIASEWFFGQPSTTTEVLVITGYDATDGGCLQDHEGRAVLACAGGDSGSLATGDAIALYVHNAGAEAIEISLVEIAGVTHLPDLSGIEGSVPAAGSFFLAGGSSSLEAGGSGTVVVGYGGADIDNERSITVVVEAGGEVSNVSVIIGERSVTA